MWLTTSNRPTPSSTSCFSSHDRDDDSRCVLGLLPGSSYHPLLHALRSVGLCDLAVILSRVPFLTLKCFSSSSDRAPPPLTSATTSCPPTVTSTSFSSSPSTWCGPTPPSTSYFSGHVRDHVCLRALGLLPGLIHLCVCLWFPLLHFLRSVASCDLAVVLSRVPFLTLETWLSF